MIIPRRRRAALAVAVGAVAAILAAPAAPANPAATQRFTYVAADAYVVGPDYAAATLERETDVEDRSPGGRLAPLGTARFTSPGDGFAITVDDAGPSSMVNVGIAFTTPSGEHRQLGHRCVPVRRATRLAGVERGSDVTLWLWSPAGWWEGCPSQGATAGILTITP